MAEKEYKSVKLEKPVFEKLKERAVLGKSYSMVVEELLSTVENDKDSILPESKRDAKADNPDAEVENPIRDYATIFNDVKEDREYALKVIDYVEKHCSKDEANTLRWIAGISEMREDE